MRAFKHPTGFHRHPDVTNLICLHGIAAYGVFWVIVELVLEWDNYSGGFPLSHIASCSRMRVNRLLPILHALIDCHLIKLNLEGSTAKIQLLHDFRKAESRINPPEWARIREGVFKRDGFACVYCGATDIALECDHRIPVSRGGSDDLSNLVTACFSCNRSKRAMTAEEFVARRRVQ